MNKEDAFVTLPGDNGLAMLLVADHATNRLPARYGSLGLPQASFSRHIAYDIGVEPLTRSLAERLGVPAVMSQFSRLLIDPNRGEDDPTLIMRLSDGDIISGNHPLSDDERSLRIEQFHRPYHEAVAASIEAVEAASGKSPLVISLHSFTPAWKGVARPWHAGILWDNDPRAVAPLIEAIAAKGYVVGDNEPYDGALRGDCMYRHCMSQGIAHALIEIRQDLIGDAAGVEEWADVLAPILETLNGDEALHERKRFASRTGPY